jgi:ketosteroid isomerase-like protein
LNVQEFGGVGVVTGKLDEKASYKGTDVSGSYRFLDVWVKRDGRWQNVAGQETRYK